MNKEPLLPTEPVSFQLEADKGAMSKKEQRKREPEEEGRITEQAVLVQTPAVTAIQEKSSDPKQSKCLWTQSHWQWVQSLVKKFLPPTLPSKGRPTWAWAERINSYSGQATPVITKIYNTQSGCWLPSWLPGPGNLYWLPCPIGTVWTDKQQLHKTQLRKWSSPISN